ncbi:helix-turn-helix domain-containing protein [Phytoactinopolyspora alkaliphila]|uniref:Helix-turn-helix domain-containing protein n=1 Tax=Phytoactinopolyspora alkaliphila TaxID=1783498 RepID=A0A6N9YM63_9ACTN|nr:LuxR family transcriptional regulator [Phytoactinopolyspora alkaliphila]NED96064.1 helix-turn-helix domain-containing protein [Phytoactinopolyspora alkaliphila]
MREVAWGELPGRHSELADVWGTVARLSAGTGRAVVVSGPPGIGKSALLRAVAARAGSGDGTDLGDLAVAHVVGSESERDWPYSGLHLVLSALAGTLGRFCEIDVAARVQRFLGGVREEVSPYEVATRLQPLIESVSVPVLMLVDDAHLLDPFSQEVLGFVSRRLTSVPVAVVLASDDAGCPAPFLALATVRLDELPATAAAQLVQDASQGSAPLRIAREIVARAGGNPGVLLDAMSRLSAAQLAGRSELGRYLPRSPVMQTLVLPELEALGDQRRLALLTASVSDDGRMAPLLHALRRYGEETVTWLLDERIVQSDGLFALRTSAVASVVWHSASHAERRAAHAAFADAYAGKDADRQLWHLARASYEEDGELARELYRVSRQALSAGELERARRYAKESARLTADLRERVDRLVAAGQLALLSGHVDDAVQLSRERFRLDTSAEQRADLAMLEARARNVLDGDVAAGLISRHVEEVVNAYPNRAARLNLVAAMGFIARMETAEAARFLALSDRGAELTDDATLAARTRMAAWLASIQGDHTSTAVPLDSWPECDDVLLEIDGHVCHAMALVHGERYDEARRLVRTAMLDGRLGESPMVRSVAWAITAVLESRTGRLTAAKAAALAWEETGIGGFWRAIIPAHMIRVYGLLGEQQSAADCRDRSAERSRRHSDWWATALAQSETGALLLLQGQFDAALSVLEHARRYALEHADPALLGVEPHYVEACVRVGQQAHAEAAVAEFEQRTLKVPSAWARHTVLRCRAMVSDGDDSVALFDEALRQENDRVSPVELARTMLCFGERLRRLGRRIDASVWLNRAALLAGECGAAVLVARAEEELRASGRRTVLDASVGVLTDAEQRIAALVAAGKRNREIAAELFVSVRTVETHLSRIFRKVGVRSRTELASVFATSDEPPTDAG